MTQYNIEKIAKGIVKLTCMADLSSGNPGFSLIYSKWDVFNISNLIVAGSSFTSYIYEWSYDRDTSTITVKNVSENRITQNVSVNNIKELLEVMLEYSSKLTHRKLVTIKK